MINGGISIKGSYHDINQDYFICKPYNEGYVLVVSDGMGSKNMSQYGSKVICETIYDIIHNYKKNIKIANFKEFLFICYEEWKKRLSEYDLKQCCTTMLVAVVSKDKIRSARLGDGFIGIYTDEKLVCLFDNKNEYFINETDCLHEFFDVDKVEILEIEYKNLKGIILCTDGVEVRSMQEDDLIDFTKEFIDEYSTLNSNQIVEDVEKWLSYWTGHDDKTIAFLIENR